MYPAHMPASSLHRKLKKKKGSKKPKEALSRTVLQAPSPRPASKSADTRKLPIVRGSSPTQFSTSNQQLTSSVDTSLVRLEKLQSMHTSARNEWLAVQERLFALGIRTRAAQDLSVEEVRDMYVDNHYEVLLYKAKPASKTPLRLPPIRRPAD